jgi:F-type H+-transporting ATPase subunit gamma
MPSLKEYRNRIASVTSTRKITSAMKMVAASKLRRAQEQAEAARPYAERMGRMIDALSANVQKGTSLPPLMIGTGSDKKHLLVVVTSDRGLCGGFNGGLYREVRRRAAALLAGGHEVKIICVGRKGRDLLRREFAPHIVEFFEGIGRKRLEFAEAQTVSASILRRFEAGEADIVTLFYNRFKSVISQVPTGRQIIPFTATSPMASSTASAVYEFEPQEEAILAQLLPRNLSVQVYKALLESAAGEQGARMTAMDNATRNASDMIRKLTLTYNRARQAYITKELIEIISGAEAV